MPVDDLRLAFWGLLVMTAVAAIAYLRRMLAVPAVPTATQIVDEMVARGKVPLVQAPVDVEAAVHRAINGSAERLKRVEATTEKLALEMTELRKDSEELRRETSELRKETGARHAENQREFGVLHGALRTRRP